MTIEDLAAIYQECFSDQFLKCEAIPKNRRLHRRPDLNAFLLLDRLVPGTRRMVADAQHDEIFLDTDVKAVAKAASREDIIDLIRCGVRYWEGSLAMFV